MPPVKEDVDYRTLFAEISRRPGLYGLDGSFEQFTAFVSGVDAGNDWQLLAGFREWLIVRLGDGNNLAWSGLVLRLAFPGGWPGLRDSLKDPEHNRVAGETLFQLLDEFLARRAAHDEPAAIFDEYLTWRRAQSWYKPSGAHTSPPEADGDQVAGCDDWAQPARRTMIDRFRRAVIGTTGRPQPRDGTTERNERRAA